MRNKSETISDWRLRGFKLRMVGEKCEGCDKIIFPPRDICPRCGKNVAPPISPGYVDKLKKRE